MSYYLAQWWDKVTNSIRTKETNPTSQHYVSETLAEVAPGVSDTYWYYVDMAGFRKGGFHFVLDTIATTDDLAITIEGTLQDDGTAPGSCSYVDITLDTFGVPSLIAAASAGVAIEDLWIDNSEKLALFKYVRIVVVATGAGDDASWTIYHRRLY